MQQTADVLVVGGGISGLSAEFELNRRGVATVIVEQAGRLGGLIETQTALGCTLETGPDSFLAAKPAVAELARELGLAHRLLDSNDARRRVYLLRDGQLRPMPKGMSLMTPTDLEAAAASGLFSEATLRRFADEPGMKPREREGDFSIQALVEDHFGREVLEDITEPLLAGVFGGAAGTLSARSVLPRFVEYERTLGSLIKGARQERAAATVNGGPTLFQSFQGGMGELTDGLAAAVRERSAMVTGRVKEIRREAGGWLAKADGELTFRAQGLVLAVPAFAAAALLRTVAPDISADLSEIPYSSAILCNLLFRAEEMPHALDGFGFLVPRRERRVVAAATWVNTKFPSRVAEGLRLVRAFLVDPEATEHEGTPDRELAEAIVSDLQRAMGFAGEPVWQQVTRWPRSMPQYVVGHEARMARVKQQLTAVPGLQLASNYVDGVGIPDCIRVARQAGAAIAGYLRKN